MRCNLLQTAINTPLGKFDRVSTSVYLIHGKKNVMHTAYTAVRMVFFGRINLFGSFFVDLHRQPIHSLVTINGMYRL